MVFPNSDGDISINYIISYNPLELEGYAFAPVIEADYFSIAGCQWMLHIGDDQQKRDFFIQLLDAKYGYCIRQLEQILKVLKLMPVTTS
ncbi:hypothetical protein ATE92_0154 [Ulvibacter sp. MAR_2010_11]|uniref:hypothetical protein n=1 Tax=Ulvibacter sp. MAR_2010_11 TaxID=1250229 RepID=UPI000C2BEABC|nr:hypothetical protein [Ulvibacter sp. MAR_2010_11]PKA82029.1 hypothetical protein ATE92_0154 [Ulvibacter sp. MAR_2010_11]